MFYKISFCLLQILIEFILIKLLFIYHSNFSNTIDKKKLLKKIVGKSARIFQNLILYYFLNVIYWPHAYIFTWNFSNHPKTSHVISIINWLLIDTHIYTNYFLKPYQINHFVCYTKTLLFLFNNINMSNIMIPIMMYAHNLQ